MAGTAASNAITRATGIGPPILRGRTFEAAAFVDASPSMNERLPGSTATKWDVVLETFPLIMRQLAGGDPSRHPAGHEEHGLSTFAFSTQTCELGRLTPGNWQERFATIKHEGGSFIMDAWRFSLEDYSRDFLEVPAASRPLYLAIILTGGKLRDAAEFTQALRGVRRQARVGVFIIGDGAESRAAITSWQQVARETVSPATGTGKVTIVHLGAADSGQLVADAVSALVSA